MIKRIQNKSQPITEVSIIYEFIATTKQTNKADGIKWVR